ncbi:hypothetical protein [Pseudomonas amygdali]|uniref:hypothetical protein n=1 Tax=Pseudomonas amygdali TaxID=47877 RepID=UPI0011C35900|nr:hypothetical protein [Pseudomonas amygdali]
MMNKALAMACAILLCGQAMAAESSVVDHYLMLEATTFNPLRFCPEGSRPVSSEKFCVGTAPKQQHEVFAPLRVADYLEGQCPGAILRSITPAPRTMVGRYGGRSYDYFAIGFEPPEGGCRRPTALGKRIE